MRLPAKFIKLPFLFDADRLAAEIEALGETVWRPHPQGNPGNTCLQFIAAHGDPKNHDTKGPMLPTPHLERCPYLAQVLNTFEAPMGRTRLMRLAPGADAISHVDTNYYWQERVRIHVPIVTSPEVRFECAGLSLHMAAGECWVFDTWERHNAINAKSGMRIHLVADTVGSTRFFEILARGERPFGPPGNQSPLPARPVPFDPRPIPPLVTEHSNQPVVMSPWEQRALLLPLLDEMDQQFSNPSDLRYGLRELSQRFMQEWRALWARFGDRAHGWPEFRAALERFSAALGPFERLLLPNGMRACEMVRQMAIRPALNPDLAERPEPARSALPAERPRARRRIDRPVFIVSSPRSGSSLLFETLAQSPDLWTVGGESHAIIEGLDRLHPAARGWESNRLVADDATPEIAARLSDAFYAALRDRDGAHAGADAALRMLEKTPKNSLRVPFLATVFPDAYFIYLYRDPRETISSMLDAWRSRRFVTYPELPEWSGQPWSLLLVPGWQRLRELPVAEIAARQWESATTRLLDDLAALSPDRWCVASYDRLVADPQAEIERLCAFVGARWDRELTTPLPLSRHTLTSPAPDKWRHNAEELKAVMPLVETTAQRARAIFAAPPAVRPPQHRSPAGAPEAGFSAAASAPDFSSSHTAGIPELLQEARSSLLVSTYQSGRVIALRARDDRLNTHFRAFRAPMGMALGPRSLAIATERQVWSYQNQPQLATRLAPTGSHDACFLPRHCHYTGDIRVHEIAYAGDELWVVNTRFSCLAVLDAEHSFVPRWRPRFISALAAEDRCHLNGLAVVDGRVRFVTALGESDAPQGWREHKGTGGVLIDVPSGEVAARNLCMPHSPRWHKGRLWVLESGKGTLATVDLDSGRVETVARLPGFTRGLAFIGPYALVGLSQVRESVFAGLPIREHARTPQCGIWLVDTRTGERAGFLRFEGQVQEIFDLLVLPGMQWPELVEADADLNAGSFVLPDAALREMKS